MKSVQIRVYGVVQGVNFRMSTREKARELKLMGIVRNQLDGSVYVEAEGDAHQIEEFITWCRRGPERSRVTEIFTTDQNPKNWQNFVIER